MLGTQSYRQLAVIRSVSLTSRGISESQIGPILHLYIVGTLLNQFNDVPTLYNVLLEESALIKFLSFNIFKNKWRNYFKSAARLLHSAWFRQRNWGK